MSKVINCECGEVVRADTDDELVQKVERHVGESHPELVGKMSREDVLGMAEAPSERRAGAVGPRPRRPLGSYSCICAQFACAASNRSPTPSS
jgi:predicted small metal-binding protein